MVPAGLAQIEMAALGVAAVAPHEGAEGEAIAAVVEVMPEIAQQAQRDIALGLALGALVGKPPEFQAQLITLLQGLGRQAGQPGEQGNGEASGSVSGHGAARSD